MREELFEKYPVPKAITTLALPTILGMLINVIYNMADTFFVGQTGDPNQVAAVSLTMPIFMILMAFGNIFGLGGGAHISRLLGQKRVEDVKHTSSFCFYACAAVGLIAILVYVIFMEPILGMIGTSENTYEFAKGYLTIIAYGAPFVCLQNAMGQIVRAEGAANQSMIGMVIGTVVNIVLDPIMILWMNMGVEGAAIATIIGNITSVLYYGYYLMFKKTALSISIKKFRIDTEILSNVFKIGVPMFINSILMSFAGIVLNNYAVGYGDEVIAANGIVGRVFTIAVMLFIGLSQGMQPFVGYNFAAKNFSRMKEAIKFCTIISLVAGLTLAVSGFLFSTQLIRVFIDNESVIGYGSMFLKALLTITPIFGVQFVMMGAFQATGKGFPALLLSVCRQGLAFIPAIILGNLWFGLEGIVWAQPFADIVSIVLAVIFYFSIFRKMEHVAEKQ